MLKILPNWIKMLSWPSIRSIFPWILMLILNAKICYSAGWNNTSKVIYPVISSKDLMISRGNMAKLSCNVRTYGQVNVSFYYQNCERLTPKPKCHRLISLRGRETKKCGKLEDGKCGEVIYELSFVPEQTGIFTCAAQYSPVIMKRSMTKVTLSENMTLVRGSQDSLICHSSSIHFENNLRWYRNGKEIREFDGVKIQTTHDTVRRNSTLFLNSFFKVNNYTYECRAYYQNDKSKYESRKILVEVDLRAPRWTSYDMIKNLSVELKLFETLSLQCLANATSNFTVHWFKDEKELIETHRTRIVEANSKLLISRLTFRDKGVYTCKVENKFGRIERSFHVKILVYSVFQELFEPHGLYWALFGFACLILIILGIFLTLNWLRKCADHKYSNNDQTIISPNETLYEQPLPLIRNSDISFGIVFKSMYESIKLSRAAPMAPKKKVHEGSMAISSPNEATYEQPKPLLFTKRLEISEDDIFMEEKLGSGEFGVVYKAKVKNIYPDELTTVAVKTLKESDTQSKNSLIKELQVMVHVGRHLNIVNLLGVVTKGKILVILEYCHHGSIQDFLQKLKTTSFINQICPKTGIIVPQRMLNQSTPNVWQTSKHMTQVTTIDLVSWAFQVACGMEYLQSKKVFHGDLAARNILLAEENVVKICDFGLARMMWNDPIYMKSDCKLPIRWLAPESIRHREFSNYSDVWSFGIVLWEMFSLGQTPYSEIHRIDIGEFLRMLGKGQRMEKPNYANTQVHRIMLQCWNIRPDMRPSFGQLKTKLANILDSTTVNHYYNLNQEHRSYNEKNAFSQPEIELSDFSIP